jgi:hypothetical protein
MVEQLALPPLQTAEPAKRLGPRAHHSLHGVSAAAISTAALKITSGRLCATS